MACHKAALSGHYAYWQAKNIENSLIFTSFTMETDMLRVLSFDRLTHPSEAFWTCILPLLRGSNGVITNIDIWALLYDRRSRRSGLWCISGGLYEGSI